MRTNQICLCFALFLGMQLSAQGDYTAYDAFEEGTYCYLLADAVNMRSEADTKAELIAKIPIGTELKILKKSNKTLTLYGFQAPWYKVAFYENGLAKSGYIWGGFIALNRYLSETDPGVSFLFGVEKFVLSDEYGSPMNNYTYQIRVCKDQKELQRISLEGIFIIRSGSISFSSNEGVEGIKNILQFKYQSDAAPRHSFDNVYFWDGTALKAVINFESYSLMNGGVSQYPVYPAAENGKRGLIIQVTESYSYNSESGEFDTTNRTEFYYIWKDEKLQTSDK